MSTDWNLGCEYHREAVWAASTSGSVRQPCYPHLVSAFIYRHRACVLKVVGDSHDFHDWTDWAHDNGDGVPEEMDECGVDDDSRRLACRICDRQPVTPPHSVCRACWDKNDWCHDEVGPEESIVYAKEDVLALIARVRELELKLGPSVKFGECGRCGVAVDGGATICNRCWNERHPPD